MSVKTHRRQGFVLYEGQVLDGLAQMADESVHCVVTSPPYWNLRSYDVAGQIGLEPTFAEFQEKLVSIFREVRRVLRSDGVLWCNLGDSFVQGATGKKRKVTGESRSWSTAMPGLKRKDMLCMPFRIAMALQADGWWLRQAVIWDKRNPLPEAVTDRCVNAHEYLFLLAKSERYFFDVESITEPVSAASQSRGSGVVKKAGRNSRFHVLHDVQHADRSRPRERRDESVLVAANGLVERRRKRSVWTVALEPLKEEHTAAFPRKLIRPAIRAGASIHGCCSECGAPYVRELMKIRKPTRPGRNTKVTGDSMIDGNRDPGRHITSVETTGWIASCACEGHSVVPCTVLDIFMGSGTTAIEARSQGMNAVGIELSPKYVKMALRRNSDQLLFR
jgi:DNA modification methylase